MIVFGRSCLISALLSLIASASISEESSPVHVSEAFPGAIYSTSFQGFNVEGGSEEFEVLQVISTMSFMSFQDAVITPEGENFRVSSLSAVMRPAGLEGVTIYATGLDFIVDPKLAQDQTDVTQKEKCLSPEGVLSLDADDLRIDFPGDERDFNSYVFKDASYTARFMRDEDCWMSGDLKIGEAKIEAGNFRMMTDNIVVGISVPGSFEQAMKSENLSLFSVVSDSISILDQRGAYITSFQDVSVSLASESPSFAPASLIVSNFLSGRFQDLNPGYDIWNLLYVMRADFKASAAGLQAHLPSVVPDEATANFSRAGLSTVQSEFEASLAIRSGSARFTLSSEVSGIGDLDLEAELLLGYFSPDQKQGDDLSTGIMQRIALDRLSVDWTDKGFSSAVEKLYGGRPVFMLSTISGNPEDMSLEGSFLASLVRTLRNPLLLYFTEVESGGPHRLVVQSEDRKTMHEITSTPSLTGAGFRASIEKMESKN